MGSDNSATPGGATKRTRSSNYTAQEKELLISLAAKYKNVIENKQTDAKSVQDKTDAWRKIGNQFNCVAPNLCFRSNDSLKKLFENMKNELRKKGGKHKKDLYLTGERPQPVLVKDETDDLLLDKVNEKSIFGLESPFDSDRNKQEKSIGSVNVLSDADDPCVSNKAIEIIFDDDFDTVVSQNATQENIVDLNTDDTQTFAQNPTVAKSNGAKYKPLDLGKLTNQPLRIIKHDQLTPSSKPLSARRRPHSTIQTLSAPTLHDKYDQLVDLKLITEEYARKEIQLRMEFLQQEHDLKIKTLQLDIEIKKKQLEAMDASVK